MATLEELLNGAQPPAPLPNVNPQGLTQAGANMATMGAQPVPVTQPSPPATPEEFNTRKSGWMQALEALRANPAAQQALMFAGARLLNGPRFGQSQGGAVGEAVFGGASMYNQLEENAAEQQRKDAEQARRDRLADTEIGLREAQTGEVRQRTAESAAKAPVEIERLQNEAKRARLEAGIKDIELKVAQGVPISDQIKQRLEKMKLDLAAVQANINQSNAAAGASSALAAERREQTKWIKPKALADISQTLSGTAENLADTAGKLSGKGGAGGTTAAGVQEGEWTLQKLAAAYPTLNPQQLALKFFELESQKKTDPVELQIKARTLHSNLQVMDQSIPDFDTWYAGLLQSARGGGAMAPAATSAPTGQRVIKYPVK